MNRAQAKIIASSTAGDLICAAAGRISTTQGTALEIAERSREKENNSTLIEKVTASGHTSTLEHQFFTIAFDSVSVCVEEFVIEFRLDQLFSEPGKQHVVFSERRDQPVGKSQLPGFHEVPGGLFEAALYLLRGAFRASVRSDIFICYR